MFLILFYRWKLQQIKMWQIKFLKDWGVAHQLLPSWSSLFCQLHKSMTVCHIISVVTSNNLIFSHKIISSSQVEHSKQPPINEIHQMKPNLYNPLYFPANSLSPLFSPSLSLPITHFGHLPSNHILSYCHQYTQAMYQLHHQLHYIFPTFQQQLQYIQNIYFLLNHIKIWHQETKG